MHVHRSRMAVAAALALWTGLAPAGADPLPDLCSAPEADPAALARADLALKNTPGRKAATVSTLNNEVVVLEYNSVYDVHTAADPSKPLNSQSGSWQTQTLLADLEGRVDRTKYDFVLFYSLSELPGWIHAGVRNTYPARNIGITSVIANSPPVVASWTRLRGTPHMNSAEFIDANPNANAPGTPGVYVAMHEMGHYWNVYWAQNSPGPRGWNTTMPVAWLAGASGHWGYVFSPQSDAGIMYSAALSPYFTHFDLYAMGLMPYAEANAATYRVHEDVIGPNPPSYAFKLDDLIASIKLAGTAEGDGRRIPATDPTATDINVLVVAVKGKDQTLTPRAANLLLTIAHELPVRWSIATRGRSVLSTALYPAAGTSIQTVSVYEFYNAALNRYFRTANADEAQYLRTTPATGEAETGKTFKAWVRGAYPAGANPVCRFYGSLNPGPNSHFYTAASAECNQLKLLQAATPGTQRRWNYEEIAFAAKEPVNGACPADAPNPVRRVYNNGYTLNKDSNHRLVLDTATYNAMIAQGWAGEGVVLCAPN